VSELEQELSFLLHATDAWRRERALGWLAARAEEANPRLLELLDGHAAGVAVPLGRLGRPESVAPLARLLREGAEADAWHAGQGLAAHPAPEALGALVAALAAQRVETVAAALGGVEGRGDPAACDAVRPLLTTADERIRERAERVVAALGCTQG
jgi:HEAT repeat protein